MRPSSEIFVNGHRHLHGRKKKIQSVVNSMNIFPHIGIVHILVIFKWLSSSVPSGCLGEAMCGHSPEADTWLTSRLFSLYFQ